MREKTTVSISKDTKKMIDDAKPYGMSKEGFLRLLVQTYNGAKKDVERQNSSTISTSEIISNTGAMEVH